MVKALTNGIHENITPDVYHADPAISRSDLLLMSKAPAFYRWAKANPDPKSSPALDLGTAFHTMIMEADLFDTRHVLSPFKDFKTNDAKAWRETQIAAGKTVITQSDKDTLTAMAMSARQHDRFGSIMKNARRELSVIAPHAGTGLTRKARPDIVPAGTALVDFKSTRDASPEGFGKEVWNLQYAQQAAHYLDCWNEVSDQKKSEFLFFACEKEPPYLCAVYCTPHELVEYGRKLNNALLYTLAHCQKTNTWPGYPSAIEEFQLPGYALRQIEEAG